MTQEELNRQFIKACKYSDLKKIKNLIKQGADVNAKDDYEWTHLHYACCYSDLELIRFLVENGANVNAENHKNRTPLNIAKTRNNLNKTRNNQEIVDYLEGLQQ